ncbi:metal-dependent hydrolase [Danxiaibacter flavus]|uniref:Metal-dependent hydrolase n=1 Tax=Danxiaibacter flavus TaxID=3049108 RepID=A0ABV3ZHB0_9BACT|nr:metal-dependent hydrolase [Chitinophagaceae bacterium DXS]
MDTLTHIAIGACIGEVLFSKQLGKKALIWGALAQSFPDIDFVGAFWIEPTAYFSVHRGVTHGLFAGLLAALIFSFLADRLHRPHDIPFRKFLLFFGLQILLHDLLDTCNAYGTGLLEPLLHRRVSFNLIYVADPLFSLPLAVAAITLVFVKRSAQMQKRIALGGLVPALAYLLFCVCNKLVVDNKFEKSLRSNDINYSSYFTTPTPFNSLLWYAVAKTDTGYYIGYRSILDKKDEPVKISYYPSNLSLLQSFKTSPKVNNLVRFGHGYYSVQQQNDTLVFNVLRFGQVLGWQRTNAPFTFHYYLNEGMDDMLAVQRGRFEGWNRNTIRFFLNRMIGKETDYPKE